MIDCKYNSSVKNSFRLLVQGLKRYIEVKRRIGNNGSVLLSKNEMNRLEQLGDAALLYIVMNSKSETELYRMVPN